MRITLVGANHRSAPVELREKLAFADDECSARLTSWVEGGHFTEALLLSTCNRVEILAVSPKQQPEPGIEQILSLLSEAKLASPQELQNYVYSYTDDDAVRHLFRVASSLDSMVVGEPQILGQLRRAYACSSQAGAAGTTLNKLLPQAFHVAKRVRNETDIASSAVSVSYMAVELGRKIFESLKGVTVLVVGAGETAELAARHLVKAGAGEVLFTNRTIAKAEELAAKFGGKAVAMDDLASHLAKADIVICSTSSTEYVITPQLVRSAHRRKKVTPTFFIDISVPRNIDPAIGAPENAFVFNIDDLESLVMSNIEQRRREAQRAEVIVDQEVRDFRQVLQGLTVGPAITRLTERMREIALEELARHRGQLGILSSEQENALEELLLSTMKKVAHPIITQMRRDALEVKL
ncbi:MAG TPA: glutamyl-tRNA reductase [Pyrinomonadaceae bacterium]|nr:glutamyl-tRNA reductase [Pyrinomonadaceae bacterium]